MAQQISVGNSLISNLEAAPGANQLMPCAKSNPPFGSVNMRLAVPRKSSVCMRITR
jgi:hypothetical protein